MSYGGGHLEIHKKKNPSRVRTLHATDSSSIGPDLPEIETDKKNISYVSNLGATQNSVLPLAWKAGFDCQL